MWLEERCRYCGLSFICHTYLLIPGWNSWKYNFVEVSGHNLDTSQTLGFYLRFCVSTKCSSWQTWVLFTDWLFSMDFWNHRGDMVFCQFFSPLCNRYQGIDSAILYALAGRYDNPIPTRLLAPIDCYKSPALSTPITPKVLYCTVYVVLILALPLSLRCRVYRTVYCIFTACKMQISVARLFITYSCQLNSV